VADVRAYKEDLLTIKDFDQPAVQTQDSMQILVERLKAMGIQDPTEEQKAE
jgi:hypothetical protein